MEEPTWTIFVHDVGVTQVRSRVVSSRQEDDGSVQVETEDGAVYRFSTGSECRVVLATAS